jgi:hypothetical protein
MSCTHAQRECLVPLPCQLPIRSTLSASRRSAWTQSSGNRRSRSSGGRNAPARESKGVPFLIDVKGQYKKHSWPVRLKKARGKLFYVLAFVPDVGRNRFFILTQEAVEREIQRDLQHAIARREARGLDGPPLSFPSVEWDFAKKREGAWKALPE